MKKRKKNKSFWVKLNDWLARYKAIIGVITVFILLAGLYGIWITFKAQELSEIQYVNSQKPNWEIEYEYSPNNVDLIRANFKSRNPNITLQKLIFFRVDKHRELLQSDFLGSSWKANNFSNDLISYTFTYSPSNKAYSDVFILSEIFNWDSCYPVAFQFDYILNGQVKIVTSLYKLHFRLIKEGRLKIMGFEFIENLPNNNPSYMINSLINLNLKNCAAKEHYDVTNLIDSVKQIIPYYKYVDSIVHMAAMDTVFSFPNNGLNYYIMPTVLLHEREHSRFMNYLNKALESEDNYDSTIYESLKNFQDFLKNNPVFEKIEHDYLVERGWDDQKAYYWRSIVLGLDIQLQYACELEREKGK